MPIIRPAQRHKTHKQHKYTETKQWTNKTQYCKKKVVYKCTGAKDLDPEKTHKLI